MPDAIEYPTIGELVRKAETQYVRGNVTISEYVIFDMYNTINKIEAYLNSKHTTGETDSLGREKPFFNIVNAASNIWFRATDLDTKDIKVRPTNSQENTMSFLGTIFIRDWMRRENFGQFLNEWGRVLARYGSASLKFVEKDGRLIPSVTPWNRLIVDQIEYDNNFKIEVLELTEAQLRKRKGYDKEVVDSLCSARRARETLRKRRKDNKNDYIKLYEIHGELPLSYITEDNEKDGDTYVQQMLVITYLASEHKKDEYDDYILYAGREAKDPNMITHLIKEDGRTLAIGAVEHLFEAQWMQNHNKKAIKDQLDLASKIIFQTADGSFVGQNALTAIENGDIMIHAINMPLTKVDNNSHDIGALQAFGNEWKALGNEIVGISEAMLGRNPPSGTAWGQTRDLLAENHGLFDLMTQNKSLYLTQMFREYIIPFLKKKMGHSKEIAAVLEANEISQIDAKYIKNEAAKRTNEKLINSIIHGAKPTEADQNQINQTQATKIQEMLQSQNGERFFKPDELTDLTWKEYFKDMEFDLEISSKNDGNTPDKDDLQTLTTVLQTIANNPRVLFDPNAKIVFNKILTITGAVSPLELVQAQPFVPLPSKRFTETLDYKDAPEDIKRQMEAQQGFQPSQMRPPAPPSGSTPIQPQPLGANPVGGGGLPMR